MNQTEINIAIHAIKVFFGEQGCLSRTQPILWETVKYALTSANIDHDGDSNSIKISLYESIVQLLSRLEPLADPQQ